MDTSEEMGSSRVLRKQSSRFRLNIYLADGEMSISLMYMIDYMSGCRLV